MIGLVLAMVWTRRGQALTLALLAMFGVAAAVGAPAYLRAADRAVADAQVDASTPAERSLSLLTRPRDHRLDNPGTINDDVDLASLGPALDGLPGLEYVYAGEFATVGMEPDDRYRTRLVHRQDVCAHLTMTAGRCVIGESDLVLGEQTAKRLRIAPGDSVTLTFALYDPAPETKSYYPNGESKTFLVTGTYRVPDPGEAYWGGRNYFAPDTGNRPGEPAFLTGASFTAMDRGPVEVTVDGYARPGALGVDSLPGLKAGLAGMRAEVERIGPAIELGSGLPDLLDRIDQGRGAAHLIVPVLAVCLVLLSCLTIFLAVGYGTEGRRPELAVVALRGARWGQRWWLATGENLVAILAGTVAGCVVAQLLVNVFAAWRFPGVGADPGLDSLRWAPAAAASAVATAILAERRQLTTPVAELLRRAPAVRRSAGAIAAEALVVLLAAVAVAQLTITDGSLAGIGTFATGLVLIAAALVISRLVLPWSTVVARRALRRGRLGFALAAFQLTRRPGAVRLFALLTAAVAVAGYAAAAVDVAARGRGVEASLGTGADRVLTFGPSNRQGLLAAVRAVDPEGRFAMAAVRVPTPPDRPPVVAVDSTRLGAVSAWPDGGPSAADAARALHPAAGEPVTIDGERVDFDITSSGFAYGKAVAVTVVLSPRTGLEDVVVPLGVLRDGRHGYGTEVPACGGGCTISSLRVVGGQGTLDVAGRIVVHLLAGANGAATDPARWRASAGGTVGAGPEGLLIEVTSLNGLPSGMTVRPASTPFPLPVLTAGARTLPEIGGLDARSVPVTVAATLPAVPGAGRPGVLADLDYLDRLSADGTASSSPQVWLGPDAPDDVVARFARQGLVATSDLRTADVRARLDVQGPALALWFYVIVAVLATALAAGALVLAAAVDRARRVEDLSALRGQGLTRAALRQATLGTYPVLVALAVPLGAGIALLTWWLTGWALPLAGLTPPALPLPGRPSVLTVVATAAGVFLVLSGVALVSGRRTLRRIS